MRVSSCWINLNVVANPKKIWSFSDRILNSATFPMAVGVVPVCSDSTCPIILSWVLFQKKSKNEKSSFISTLLTVFSLLVHETLSFWCGCQRSAAFHASTVKFSFEKFLIKQSGDRYFDGPCTTSSVRIRHLFHTAL